MASGLTEPGARAVEMEVESFILNFPRYGDKTFKKVVVIDNKNQNRDKLDLLLNSTNTNIEISFLNNAKIDKWKHKEGGSISEQPNVTWKDGHEEELNIYLNDIFGFKPDQIEFKKSNQTPPPGPNGPSSPPQKNPPPKNPPTNDRDQEIRQLKARIKELEEKLRQNPNSPTAQDDRATLDKLKKELNQKEKGHNPSQSNSDQFPYLLVFGIGAVAVFLMVAIYLMVRSRRHQKS
ncbi:MAG: hypothetical protein I3275_03965 [Candidatus Moeniiplasma glomeromycotorum]|nr:hypothetical protein [Candidatus Moeniiplasma glomeromycotorum]